MQAMVVTQRGSIDTNPLVLRDVAIPKPAPGEVLVRVEASGICRTDLHAVEGELPAHRQEIIPGHQVVGVVENRGEGSERFQLGDRIGIAWLRSTCGQCRYCRMGRENLCTLAKFAGYDEDGGFAEYATVNENYAYALPGTIDPVTAAPLLCAGIIGYRCLRRADVTPGCRLGLFGFGSSASIVIQVACHWGCTVYVMTRDERHRKLARELGAAWAVGSEEMPPEPLDSAILFASVGSLVAPALEALDSGGTLAVAGIYLTDIPMLNYERHLFHEKNLRSVTAIPGRWQGFSQDCFRSAASSADYIVRALRCESSVTASQARRDSRFWGASSEQMIRWRRECRRVISRPSDQSCGSPCRTAACNRRMRDICLARPRLRGPIQ